MNFNDKKLELASLIQLFLKNKKSIQDLQSYAWNSIDEFYENNEKVFWYAIWQIQHLASEDHLKDGTLKRELEETLKYLLNQEPFPRSFTGEYPQ